MIFDVIFKKIVFVNQLNIKDDGVRLPPLRIPVSPHIKSLLHM